MEIEPAIILGINTARFPAAMIAWKAVQHQIRQYESMSVWSHEGRLRRNSIRPHHAGFLLIATDRVRCTCHG